MCILSGNIDPASVGQAYQSAVNRILVRPFYDTSYFGKVTCPRPCPTAKAYSPRDFATEVRLLGTNPVDKTAIGVRTKAEDRKLPLLPPASLVQEILLSQQGVGHSLASLGSGEDKGEGPALR